MDKRKHFLNHFPDLFYIEKYPVYALIKVFTMQTVSKLQVQSLMTPLLSQNWLWQHKLY